MTPKNAVESSPQKEMSYTIYLGKNRMHIKAMGLLSCGVVLITKLIMMTMVDNVDTCIHTRDQECGRTCNSRMHDAA